MEMRIRLRNVNDAAYFSTKCSEYHEDIDFVCGKYMVDAKSLMGVLSVGLDRDDCFVCINTQDCEVMHKFKDDMSLWA